MLELTSQLHRSMTLNKLFILSAPQFLGGMMLIIK